MSIHYIVLDQGSLVLARAFETLTNADLVACERRVLKDHHVRRGFRQLLDCRWVRENDVDHQGLAALASLHSEQGARLAGSSCAIVSTSSVWFQGRAEYSSDQSGLTIVVFNDPQTACIWLGVDYAAVSDYFGLGVCLSSPQKPWTEAVRGHQ